MADTDQVMEATPVLDYTDVNFYDDESKAPKRLIQTIQVYSKSYSAVENPLDHPCNYDMK